MLYILLKVLAYTCQCEKTNPPPQKKKKPKKKNKPKNPNNNNNKKRKGLRVSDFALLLSIFKWYYGSEGVTVTKDSTI